MSGTTVFVYRSTIEVSFNTNKFFIPCVFNPQEDVPLLPGRAGIMDRFTITMDAKKKLLISTMTFARAVF